MFLAALIEHMLERKRLVKVKQEVDGKTPKIQRRRAVVEVRGTFGPVSPFGKIQILKECSSSLFTERRYGEKKTSA